jgi:hypothetical protein
MRIVGAVGLIVLLAVALLIPVAIGHFASTRGRHFWPWFGVGLALGPLAAIPLFALGDLTRSRDAVTPPPPDPTAGPQHVGPVEVPEPAAVTQARTPG